MAFKLSPLNSNPVSNSVSNSVLKISNNITSNNKKETIAMLLGYTN